MRREMFVMVSLCMAACSGKTAAPSSVAAADATVAVVPSDAAVLAPPAALAKLAGLPLPTKGGCGGYADAVATMVAGVDAARGRATSVNGVTEAAASFLDEWRRLRPLAPAGPGNLPTAHNAIMSALDRLERGSREGADAMRAGDAAALAAADAVIAAGADDLRFALGKVEEVCGGTGR